MGNPDIPKSQEVADASLSLPANKAEALKWKEAADAGEKRTESDVSQRVKELKTSLRQFWDAWGDFQKSL